MADGNGALLDIRGLDVSFQDRKGGVGHALRGVDLSVEDSEIRALVGESGSGKTVTSTCIMGLLPVPPGRINAGRILFRGRDLLALSAEEHRKLRGRQMAMVFQEPSRYLNPAFRIGEQITEMLGQHLNLHGRDATARAEELLGLVGLPVGGRTLARYPHELSGGMKQRAMIAMAVSCNPAFLIADEPTTALDVTLQMQILALIRGLRDRLGMGILFISHDLRLVRVLADSVSVIYAGTIVETAPAAALFARPLHPYTRLLLDSIPLAAMRGRRLAAIRGRVPDAQAIPQGCAFHPRCPLAEGRCAREGPVLETRDGAHWAACHCTEKPWTP